MSRRNTTIEKLPDGASLYEGIGAKKMPEEMDELLTVREVARRLRVDDTTVRRWIKSGALEAVTLPNTPALPVVFPASTNTTTMIMPKPMNSSMAAIGALLSIPPKVPAIRFT